MVLTRVGIHFKKLWHKVAVVYSGIIVALFLIFYFSFESTLIRYFEDEQVRQYEKALGRLEILMEEGKSYPEMEEITRDDEFIRSYEVLIYDDENLLMGREGLQELLWERMPIIKTSRGIVVDTIKDGREKDYWIFEDRLGDRTVYFIKDIDELSSFYMGVISLIVIFAVVLSLLFILLSLITSKWLLRPIFEILDTEKNIELDSEEELDMESYSEDELRRIIALKNDFIVRVREFVNKEKRFVANASHEMLTPITVIKGYSEVLRWGREDEKVFQEALDAIEDESERMEKLMNSLLLLSRIDKEGEGDFEDLRLGDIISDEVERLKWIYERPIEVKAEDVKIRGDAGLLCQCVRELVKNAMKYSSDEVVVEVARSGVFAVIRVRDRGKGIEEEFLHRIFERFSQEEESKTSEGYGLGLPIVKEIVNLHRGKIEIKSRLCEGTEVSIKIPIEKGSS